MRRPTTLIRFELSAITENNNSASVAVANVQIVEESQQTQLIRTHFVLRDQRSNECRLELPEQHEIVDLQVGAVSVPFKHLGRGVLEFPTSGDGLPQVVTATTSCKSNKNSGAIASYSRPRVSDTRGNVPVNMTLWDLASRRGQFSPVGSEGAVSQPSDFSMLRLARVMQVLEAVGSDAPTTREEDRGEWVAGWFPFLEAIRTQDYSGVKRRRSSNQKSVSDPNGSE